MNQIETSKPETEAKRPLKTESGLNQNPELETIAKPLKGSTKGVQFKTVPEQQKPGTSESVKRDETLVKVRPGSTKEALSKETKEEVVETKPVLSKNKCSAET